MTERDEMMRRLVAGLENVTDDTIDTLAIFVEAEAQARPRFRPQSEPPTMAGRDSTKNGRDAIGASIGGATTRISGIHLVPKEFENFAPGVRVNRVDLEWADQYVGSSEALVAAGLIQLDQLPGQRGLRREKVIIQANGEIFAGSPAEYEMAFDEPGARQIERVATNRYRVLVSISDDEFDCRMKPRSKANLRLVSPVPGAHDHQGARK